MNAPRPKLLTFLAVAQWLLAATFFYVTTVSLRKELLGVIHDPRTSWGVFLTPITFLLLVVAFWIAGHGIWKQHLWGQWIAVVVLGLTVASVAYNWYARGEYGGRPLPTLILFSLLLFVHLLPGTWRAFRLTKLESPAATI